ncbi:MAG: RIP metalloprotease RseP [Succinivibrio sp.]
MGNVLGQIVYFLLSLGILVTIHEFGHFIVARKCGVKVLRFSIGFGPLVLKKTGKDGCEYAISAIPLGGYVKMLGENEDLERNEDGSLKALPSDSFKAKKVWQRALIIFAGPFFNIALAVILFTIVNLSGVVERLPVVGDVVPQSAAAQSGMRAYDRIVAIDGTPVNSWSDVMMKVLEYTGSSSSMNAEVKGDLGNGDSRILSLNLENIEIGRNESPLEKVGIRICYGRATSVIGLVIENSAASRAQLQQGDKIISINGVEVDNWYRISDAIAANGFGEMKFVVERDGNRYQTTVIPDKMELKGAKRYKPYVGIGASFEEIDGLTQEVNYGLFGAFVKALGDAASMSKLVVVSAYKLVTGAISKENISGPIAIAKGAQESASFGLIMFIGFLAAISVNLGILNLLPVPVLDGGQLLFLAYEAVTKREPSPGIQTALVSVGAFLLIALTVFAVFNDIRSF